jgi:hypothetical protein
MGERRGVYVRNSERKTPLGRPKIYKKAVPLQAWTSLEGSKRLRLQDFKTIGTEGSKVVSRTHRPPLPPGKIHGTHFC